MWFVNEFLNNKLIQKFISKGTFFIKIKNKRFLVSIVFLLTTIYLSNFTINKHIVIPQLHEQNYLRSKLDNDMVRYKLSNSESLNIVLKNYIDYSYLAEDILIKYDSGAATFQYFDWTPLILNGVLREYGLRKPVYHGNTKIIENNKPSRTHLVLPWGRLIYGINVSKNSFNNKIEDIIYIDMNELKKIYK